MNEEKNNRSDEEIVTAEEEKKSTFKRVRRGIGRAFGFIMQRPLLQSLFLSLCLFSLVDMLHYRSIFGSLVHFVTYPHFFLLNVLIVWFTLLPALFLRRRCFFITFMVETGISNISAYSISSFIQISFTFAF